MIILSSLSKQQLERIYELTYKYGWLMREYEDKGWLPDKAYLEFNKIQSQLIPLIQNGLEGMLETYNKWLAHHEREGWIKEFKDYASGRNVREYIERLLNMDTKRLILDYMIRDIVPEDEIRNDLNYYIEAFSEAYLAEAFNNPAEYTQKFGDDFIEKIKEGKDNLTSTFIKLQEEYGNSLTEDFIKHMASYFDPDRVVRDIYERDPSYYSELYQEELLNFAYDAWVGQFSESKRPGGKALVEEIEDVRAMRDELSNYESLDLDEQIILFQKGLNTAHHFGTMADHLLKVGPNRGKQFLDALSGEGYLPNWDMWLTKVMGHPPGELQQQKEYFQPN